MSDINLNLDGLLAFLAAAGLGLLLILAMLIGSTISAIKARQKHQRFSHQRFFPHLLGMCISLLCCFGVELMLLLTDSNLPPRRLPGWLDRWVLVWVPAVLLIWPIMVQLWLRKRPGLDSQMVGS